MYLHKNPIVLTTLLTFLFSQTVFSADLASDITVQRSAIPKDPIGAATCVLDLMKDLESRKDAKCFATANRMESYMYGTPLNAEARYKKVELQKQYLKQSWVEATDLSKEKGLNAITDSEFETVFSRHVRIDPIKGGDFEIFSVHNDTVVRVNENDLRHYGSIAYGLRLILSLQQDAMLDVSFNPGLMTKEASNYVKQHLDIITLAALQLADGYAVEAGNSEVGPEDIQRAWNQIFEEPAMETGITEADSANREAIVKTFRGLIKGKLTAYNKYNALKKGEKEEKFFHFIEKNWAQHKLTESRPKTKKLLNKHRYLLEQWSLDLYQDATSLAITRGHSMIRAEDVEHAMNNLMPHTVDDHEDVIYYPSLPAASRVKIAAYDLDSFRDFGTHWSVLETVFNRYINKEKDSLILDPFAAEIFVEGVAQYAVLLWRVGGRINAEKAKVTDTTAFKTLKISSLDRASDVIVSLTDWNFKSKPELQKQLKIESSDFKTDISKENRLFERDTERAAGIDFHYRVPEWKKKWVKETSGQKVFKVFHGGGVGARDINGDGNDDLLMVSGKQHHLYFGDGKGKFTDVTEASGLLIPESHQDKGEGFTPMLADFDNDGHPDILVTYSYNYHLLYRNRGDGTFENLTLQAKLGGEALPGAGATVADFDGDGLLDLYIVNFGDTLGKSSPSRGFNREDLMDQNEQTGEEAVKKQRTNLPSLSRSSRNGIANILYKNMGNFVFKDVTEGSGADDTGWGNAVSHTDFDRDGDQDIFVANDFGRNALLRNEGNMKFKDITYLAGMTTELHSMNVGMSDLNGDGYPDFHISNINAWVKDLKYTYPEKDTPILFSENATANMRVVRRSTLYLSGADDKGRFDRYYLTDDAVEGVHNAGWAWDADFFDADNDGDDDAFVVNGYSVYFQAPPSEKHKDGREGITRGRNYKQKSILFINEGGKLKTKKGSLRMGGVSYSAVYVDYDSDGDLDIVMNRFEEPAELLINKAEKFNNRWIKLKLTGDVESGSNRDAIGSKLLIKLPGGKKVWREIHGGSGYLSFEPLTVHAGVHDAETVDVEIIWPNGQQQTLSGLATNNLHLIRQNAT